MSSRADCDDAGATSDVATAPGAATAGSPVRRPRATVGTWLRCLVALGLLATAAVSLLDAGGFVPIVQALAPTVGVVGALLAAAWAIRRRWASALAAAVATLVMLLPVLPPMVRPAGASSPAAATGVVSASGSVVAEAPGSATPGPVEARTWRVMALNTLYGSVDPVSVVDAVRSHRIDVLVLSEVSAGHWAALARAGLTEVLGHASGRVGGAGGTIIASSMPVDCLDIPGDAPCGEVVPGPLDAQVPRPDGTLSFDLPVVRLPDGTILQGVHAWSPRMAPASRWHEQQLELRRWRDAQPPGSRLIMAGDFNSGPSHPGFRRLAEGMETSPGWRFPWTRTWPLEWSVPAFVAIDHVLSRGFAVTGEGVLALPGSDHGAVWAELAPRD